MTSLPVPPSRPCVRMRYRVVSTPGFWPLYQLRISSIERVGDMTSIAEFTSLRTGSGNECYGGRTTFKYTTKEGHAKRLCSLLSHTCGPACCSQPACCSCVDSCWGKSVRCV